MHEIRELMSRIKVLLICILYFLNVSLCAQTVSGTFYNVSPQMVYLNAYTGLYMETVDSVMMSEDGRVEFDNVGHKGMYQIETESGLYFDFLCDDEPVAFVLKNENNVVSVEFIRSWLNNDWHKYKNERASYDEKQQVLKQVLRNYDSNTSFYKEAKYEFEKNQTDFKNFTDSLISHGNYASKLISVDRPPFINTDDSFTKQREDMKTAFFEMVDFTDTTLIPTNVLTTKVIDYLSILQFQGQTPSEQEFSVILGIDNVMNLASVSYPMYRFVFEYLMIGFHELGFNAYLDYLMRMPYVEQLDADDVELEEIYDLAEKYSRVKIGIKAPEITGVDINNVEFGLYDIDNDYVILLFWSYSCAHCREIMKEMKYFLKENTDFTFLSVCVNGERKDIKKLIRKNGLKGYFYHDGLSWNSPVVNAYAVTATPSIFIIDKDKKIVAKPFGFEEINDFVNSIR